MYEHLLDPPCWELEGQSDPSVAFAAFFELFDDRHSLVLESAGPAPEIKSELALMSRKTGNSDTQVTKINGETELGWAFEIPLGRPMPGGLIRLCENHAEPEYCDHCFVFLNGAPVILWFDFPNNLLTVRPEVPESLVREVAKRMNRQLRKVER